MKIPFLRIPRFIKFETLKLTLPFGKTLLIGVLIFPLIIMGMELLLRNPIVYAKLPPSTVIGDLVYPEIDVKYQKFETRNKESKINCIFLGNSMVDQALDPEIVLPNNKMSISGQPNCFNFGLQSMMPGTSVVLAKALINKYGIRTIILGISAVDFQGDYYLPRDFIKTPWLRYLTGQETLEGRLVDQSIVYRYFLALGKYKDPDYQNMTNDLGLLISNCGQNRKDETAGYNLNPVTKFPNYSLYQPEVDALAEFGEFKRSNIQIIVVEMPVDPKFLPFYVQNREKGYKEEFIDPITQLLEKQNIPFIRSQPEIGSVISSDGWVDYAHLNKKGAAQFSRWLAQKISSKQ